MEWILWKEWFFWPEICIFHTKSQPFALAQLIKYLVGLGIKVNL